MNNIETGLIAGFAGGIVRGLSSYLKKRNTQTAPKFDYAYFLTTVFFSGVIGGACGALAESTWKTDFFAGYAGMDFIENMYKIRPGAKTA